MKRILAILGSLVVLMTFSACGPERGTVVNRNHTEEWYSTIYIPCGTNGTSLCPQIQYYPESWALQLDEDPLDDEKPGWRNVSSGMYEACPIGSFYTYDRENKSESCSS